MSVRDLIIVGAGPSGLSAAIAARQRDLDYQVLEQGVLVNSIYRFPPQMVFFTTPELLEIGGLPFVSPYEKPTRAEALQYYRKVVDKYDLQISFDETVLSVVREDDRVRARDADLPRRPAGPARAQRADGHRLLRPPEPHRRAGRGSAPRAATITPSRTSTIASAWSSSAAGTRRRKPRSSAIARGAHVTLVHRRPELKSTIKYWVRPDIENRIKEGSIAARVNTCVKEIKPTSVIVRTAGSDRDEELPADAVLLLTGYRSDSNLLRAAGVRLNERDVPEYNPDTLETNVPGLFLAGGAVTGHGHQQHLHRERPVPRREDRAGDCGQD